MEISEIVVQFFIVLIGLFLFFLLKNFWPKYFETKGANQATREDIGEITKIVEEIKTKLMQETELLKAHISVTNQHKLNLKSAEREALIDLNRKGAACLYFLSRFDFTSYNVDNYLEMDSEKLEFKKRQYEYDLSQAHLSIFMHDNVLLGLIQLFSVAMLEFEERVFRGVIDLKLIMGSNKIELEGINLDHLAIIQKYHGQFMVFYSKFGEDSVQLFQAAYSAHLDLVKVLYKRIRELEEDLSN